ncbi:MAG: hypothetical protein AB7O45_11940 [Alphaproteobacteria bacterium]
MAKRAGSGRGGGKPRSKRNHLKVVPTVKPAGDGSDPVTGASALTDEVVKMHLDEIVALDKEAIKAQDAARKVRNTYRSRIKVAKAAGLLNDAINKALKESKRDAVDLEREYAETVRYLRIMGHPVGTQFALFGDLPNAKAMAGRGDDTVELAARYGAQDFADGAPNECKRYRPGTEQYAAWTNAWNAAFKAKFSGGKPAPRGIGDGAPAGNA